MYQHAAVIRVNDVERMLAWYRDVLGLPLIKYEAGFGVAVLDMPGPSYICLYKPREAQPEGRDVYPRALINWRCADAARTREELLSRGVDCAELIEMPGLRLFTFYDPEGTYHDCCEYDERWLGEKKRQDAW
jgi:catechol 2,3-dioxygenase-like lactoylglutathione lyase family enzyme